MKLGLLSDTHGHAGRTTHALKLLNAEGVGHFIHCGDVGSDLVLDQLFEQQENGIPVTVVPGNVDEWDPGIMMYARALGFPFHRVARVELAGFRIAVHHGHDPGQMDQLRSEEHLDLLFTGHTHVAMDDFSGNPRVINPGAVYRAQVPSVAVVELGESISLRSIPLA